MKTRVGKCLVVAAVTVGALVSVPGAAHASGRCIDFSWQPQNTGHCVSDIQFMLNYINSPLGQQGRSGYAPVPPQLVVDGVFGSATSFVVGHYQAWKHETVDGHVHVIPTWGDYCNETAVSDWLSSPDLRRHQAALAAVDAGCVLHP